MSVQLIATDNFLVSMDNEEFGVHKLIQKLFCVKLTGCASLEWIRHNSEPINGFDPPG